MKRQHAQTSAGPRVVAPSRVVRPGTYGDPSVTPHGSNRLAVAAATVGVVSLATSMFIFGGCLALLGLAFSALALRGADRSGSGRRAAMTGLVTSILAIVVSIAAGICVLWFAHKTHDCYHLHQVHQWIHCAGRQFARD